jgi:signal transduction histidine kinase
MRQPVITDELFDPYFLQSLIHHAAYLLDADGSAFYLWESEARRASLLANHNLSHVRWDDTIPQRAVDSGRTLIETFPQRPTLLAAPLSLQENLRGVLVVADWAASRKYSDHDVFLIESLADLAALASRQTRRLARMTAQFRALHAIDVALSSSLQPERVLSLILEKAVELVGAEHGSLRRLNPETGELLLKAHFGEGWSEEKKAYTPKVGEGIVQWVAENRRPYLCQDVRKDPRYVVLFADMRSSVAVPLLNSPVPTPETDDFLGVLLLESSRPAAFDQRDVELLDALAQEAVIVIQNATQHQRLQAMHVKLQSEHEKRLAAEKWTVMGQAATSLAHRINNLIGLLPASAVEIRRTLASAALSPSDRAWAEANLDRIDRNARFVLRLGDALFRPFKETGPPGRFDVNRLLDEALEAADLPPTIRVKRRYASGLPPVESSPLLVDTFLELITNARKALRQRPRQELTIRTALETEATDRCVVVAIGDTGGGLAPERMPHLWDMFQQSDTGLGFGLWWLRTFIVGQGGTIDCESAPEEGTTFTIRLPAAPQGEKDGGKDKRQAP